MGRRTSSGEFKLKTTGESSGAAKSEAKSEGGAASATRPSPAPGSLLQRLATQRLPVVELSSVAVSHTIDSGSNDIVSSKE